MKLRKQSKALQEITKEWEDNPVVGHHPGPVTPRVTTQAHINELQDLLVQTCIDYIQEHDLTDIYSVHFSVDDLQESVKYGGWQSSTDSYIGVKGIKSTVYERKNGEEFNMPETYLIGERV